MLHGNAAWKRGSFRFVLPIRRRIKIIVIKILHGTYTGLYLHGAKRQGPLWRRLKLPTVRKTDRLGSNAQKTTMPLGTTTWREKNRDPLRDG